MSDIKHTWKERGVEWLFSQGVSTVLLVIHLGLTLWLVFYTVQYAIPEHLKQIQAGYDRQAESHAQTVKYIMDSFREAERSR